jgi:hypothetical protein
MPADVDKCAAPHSDQQALDESGELRLFNLGAPLSASVSPVFVQAQNSPIIV